LHLAECSTTQVVPGGNDTTLRTRITCDLGKNATWTTADRVEITLPVIAGASATGTVNNTAKVTDDKNRTNEDSHPVIIIPPKPVGVSCCFMSVLCSVLCYVRAWLAAFEQH
jgi:hypothetical protein